MAALRRRDEVFAALLRDLWSGHNSLLPGTPGTERSYFPIVRTPRVCRSEHSSSGCHLGSHNRSHCHIKGGRSMSKAIIEEPVQTKDTTPTPSTQYGVHSEVGKLRKVLVC